MKSRRRILLAFWLLVQLLAGQQLARTQPARRRAPA
jgi:hypothetical protein